MDTSVTHLILPVAAACVGGVMGWVASTGRSRAQFGGQLGIHERAMAELNAQLQAQIERRATLEAEAQRAVVLDEQLRERIAEVTQLSGVIGRVEAELAGEQRNHAEERERITEMNEQLTANFRSLSSQALASNNQQFLDLAKEVLTKHHERAQGDLTKRHEAIELLVKPLHESLKGVEQQVGDMEKTRLTAQATLIEQVRSLETTAGTLATALRAPKARGRWGELQLRRVVELAGMVDRCDFVEQASTTTDTGRLQPDMVVHLPAGKTVVLDAKTPMDSYLRAIESTDPEARIAGMKEHALRVKQHVVELSRKGYWKQFDATPEFVVMFLPGEDLFSAALEYEPGLIEYSVEHGVMITTPTSLIAMLRAISHGWREQALAENARQIRDLGRELYERAAKIADHWANVGKHLDKAVGSYNESVSSLESRFLVTARRFTTLDVPSEREIKTLTAVDTTPLRLQSVEMRAPDRVELDVTNAYDPGGLVTVEE